MGGMIRRVVGRKKVNFLIWRRTSGDEYLEEYRRMKRMVGESRKRILKRI